MSSTIKYATKVEIPSSSTSNHYKQWKDKSNLLGTGYSTCYSRSSPLAGKNGTYHTPAPVVLTDFGFNVPKTAKISKVIVRYSQRKEQLSSPIGQTAYPAVKAPKITLLNSNGLTATGSDVPTNYTTYTKEFAGTAEFTGVTPSMINSNQFGVRIEYPKNANTNPGVVWLGNVNIEVIYEDNTTVLNIINDNSNITVNEDFLLTFECTYTGIETNILQLPIDLDGVSYVSSYSGTGGIINQNGEYYWAVGFTSTGTQRITVKLKSTSTGNKTISISDGTNTAERTITVSNDTRLSYTNGIVYAKHITQGKVFYYNIVVNNQSNRVRYDSITITFPETTVINNLEELSAKYGGHTGVLDGQLHLFLAKNFEVGIHNIPLHVTFNSTGYYTQELYYNGGINSISNDFTVYESELGELAFEYIKLPQSVTDNMAHNVYYTLSCFTRWVTGTDGVTIRDHGENLRIGVFNSHQTYVSNDEDFLNHVTWSNSLPGTEFKETRVSFKYNEYNPVYLVFSHSYVLETNYHYIGLEYSEPILIETAHYNNITNDKPLFKNIRNILTDGDYTSAIIPVATESSQVLTYDFNYGGLDRQTNGIASDLSEIIVHGIEIEIDYTSSELVNLETRLNIPNLVTSTRNMPIKGSGTVKLGSKYDTWGVKLGNLQNKLNVLGVMLKVINNGSKTSTVEFNNLRLNVYYMPRGDFGKYGFICDGERSQDYGVYLNEVDLPFGTKFEKEEYHINGTDETTLVRTNIDSKEIKMEISIDDCDETDIIYLVDKLEQLLTNQRELQTNKPIPKSIAFDIMPNWKYRFVRVKEFDGELTNGSYEAKITLLVPNGVRESINKTITGSDGTTGSYVPIKPIIYARSNTNGSFNLRESKSNSVLSIKNNNIKEGDQIIVDNEERQIKLVKQSDNSQTVLYSGISLETTWFIIQGEYTFRSDTSNVYQVEYYDKR